MPRTFGSESMSASPPSSPPLPSISGLTSPHPPQPVANNKAAATRNLTRSILDGLSQPIHEQQHEHDEWEEVGDHDNPAKCELVPADDDFERGDGPRNDEGANGLRPVRLDLEPEPEDERADDKRD